METVLTEGLMVTILGFSTVFVVLGFISIILSVFGKVAAKTSAAAAAEESAPVGAGTEAEEENTDMSELIAVITAAIAASEKAEGREDIGPDKLVVRSLRKINSWNKETIHEQQHNSLL